MGIPGNILSINSRVQPISITIFIVPFQLRVYVELSQWAIIIKATRKIKLTCPVICRSISLHFSGFSTRDCGIERTVRPSGTISFKSKSFTMFFPNRRIIIVRQTEVDTQSFYKAWQILWKSQIGIQITGMPLTICCTLRLRYRIHCTCPCSATTPRAVFCTYRKSSSRQRINHIP